MALQFVFGGSGSGKSHYLYQRIIREAGEHPALNYMVLVPEQFTMQTQKDLVLMNEKKGIMNIDVLSFGRLAYRIFEETGKGNTPVLDDEGKNLILRKIAGDIEPELRVLKGNMKRLGYISEVKSVLSEFDQYDIGEEELDRVMKRAGEESYLYYKLQDMSLIYKKFREYLRDRYITKEEILDVLCRTVPESELLKRSVVVLDGFTGFTPVQNRLLAELMKLTRDVIVTVTIDDREDPYRYTDGCQMFGMSKHTVTTLTRIARECGVEQTEPVWLKKRPFYRFRKSEALAFLEEHLFRYSGRYYIGKPDTIAIHETRTPKEEAYAAAAQIRRLVREEGMRYREIGVVATDLNGYGDYLEEAFAKYRIPVFMDYKRSILLNSFVEYVRSILNMAEQSFTYESVFRFLRAGYGPFTDDEVDELENYCLALGIRGYKNWQQRWVRRGTDVTEDELEHLNHLRVKLVELVDGLLFVLRQRKKTVRDITEALYRFLEEQELQQELKRQEDAFTEEGELALAREYAQVYSALIGLFDKFVELLGDEPVTLKEYVELLDAGLNEIKIGVIPPGLDQVIAGDVQRTRLKDIRVLLMLGVNDSLLPGNLMRTGLLSEQDRAQFEQENLSLTPGGREQAYIQKFYLYLNLTKPEEELHLFYSRSGADGKAKRPAYLIGEIRRLFPDAPVIDEASKPLTEQELTPEIGLQELIRGLRMQSDAGGSSWMELYNWYKKHSEWAEKIGDLLDASFYSYHPKQISEEAAKLLYGTHFQNSISRMEKFSACAFAHFLTYGLRLKERDEYEFQPLDLGNVFHSAMERYSGKAEKEGGWAKIEEEKRQQLVRESLDESIADYGNSVLYSSARNEYMITRLDRLLNRTVWALTEQLARGDFEPSAYEMSFGSGKIDRIDVCETRDEVYVKVIDYKTGQKGFDVSALYYGLQLQLMVYMNAATDRMKKRYPGKQVIPSGVFYYRMKDPLLEKNGKADLEKRLLKELRPDGVVNLEQNSLEHLERDHTGDSLAVPVKFNNDGGLSKVSRAVSQEEFHTMMEYADQKAAEIRQQIVRGEVAVQPYRQGQNHGCEHCIYQQICGFDPQLDGYEYLDRKKLTREEAVAKMQSAVSGETGKVPDTFNRKEDTPWESSGPKNSGRS